MDGDEFAWDEDKAKRNFAKHHVSFEDAARAFDDFDSIEDADPYPYEDRTRLIAMVDGRLVFVVFTELPDGRRRIISARKAKRDEQDRYFAENR